MGLNILEKVEINNSSQWILVRGKSLDNPLIIHVQAGPGLPMVPEADALEKRLKLENNFLVAYWDQRACGKSFSKETDPKTINFSQLTDDVITCTEYLLKKYKKGKATLIGYSVGATLSLMAASKDSRMFERLFLVGIDIDLPFANDYAIEFAISKARAKKNNTLLKQAAAFTNISINDAKQFQKRAKILTDLGAIKMRSSYNQLLVSSFLNMILSKAYRISDIPKTVKGMEFCLDAFLPEMNTLNMFDRVKSVEVPVHFIQGRQDGMAPYDIAVKYYQTLRASKKTFTSFENSAHLPQYDEPEKFTRVLIDTINEHL